MLSFQKNLVDMVIHPEAAVAQEIIRLVKHPYADKFYEFEMGKQFCFQRKLIIDLILLGVTVEDFHKKNTDFKSLVVAIIRG
jgi:trk system potassium uptake protein TrkA